MWNCLEFDREWTMKSMAEDQLDRMGKTMLRMIMTWFWGKVGAWPTLAHQRERMTNGKVPHVCTGRNMDAHKT